MSIQRVIQDPIPFLIIARSNPADGVDLAVVQEPLVAVVMLVFR